MRLPYLDLTNLPKKQHSIFQQANAKIVVNKALPLSGEFSLADNSAFNALSKSRLQILDIDTIEDFDFNTEETSKLR